ncbi:hypothetical protein LJR030_000443 [Rhizobium sp. LjRoot30]|uniref:hypothetical protein n=1 Tax=Rhizobium sp. LjRoot30 TaxID=3342320 RepID=UPI003ECC8119
MPTMLQRLGSCTVGYLWAAFMAAIALTILRAASDVSTGTMSPADVALAVPYFAAVMTATIAVAAFVPAVIAIIIGEVFFSLRAPVRLGYTLIAGMAVGFFLAMKPELPIWSALTMIDAEALFRIASGGIGGVAFYHFSKQPAKSGIQPI